MIKDQITQLTQITSYLTFKLAEETFAVNVSKVLEILEVPQITKVPKSPDYMVGVINLRGNVLPVVDTRVKFGLDVTKFNINTCIAVISITINDEILTVGALVDAVQEVLEITPDEIQPSPSIGSKYKPEFIEGMVKVNERFIMVLNIDQVFSSNELQQIKETSSESATI